MSTKAFELVILNPKKIHFERQDDTLSLTLADGTHYPRVTLRSCFPVSDQEAYLSIHDVSSEEEAEIGIIETLADLGEQDRQAVIAELGLHYFVPKIEQVLKVKDELGFLYWTVETDKGQKEFAMRNSVIHYAREVRPGNWLLIDVNEARYEIPSVDKLDRSSQKLVSRFLYL